MTGEPDTDGSETPIAPRAAGRYLAALVAGILAVPGLYLTTLAVLGLNDILPPPQFSNSICIDEKLAAMRRSPPRDVDLLVIGSSVAWRHFNSPVAIEAYPDIQPYNAGFCGAKIDQTETIVTWLTQRLASVQDIIMVVSPIDFEQCSNPAAGGLFPSDFNVEDVDDYVFEDAWPALYYLRNFDPWTLWLNRRDIDRRRSNMTDYGALVINEFGDGPIEPEDRRLLYEAPNFDDTCFDGLRRMALDLRAQDIGFSVVMTPLHPEWLRLYDEGGRMSGFLDQEIRTALSETDARVLETGPDFGEAAFFDGIHIRWSYTDTFTRSLIEQVRPSS